MLKRISVVVRRVETDTGEVWEAWGELPSTDWGRLSRQARLSDMVREVRAINGISYAPRYCPPVAFA